MIWFYVCVAATLLWLAVLFLPWRPWLTRESLDADPDPARTDLNNVVTLIPARNEAQVIRATLTALAAQGSGLKTVVIDDQSQDDTSRVALNCGTNGVTVLSGTSLPSGWTGKLWALAQGRPYADRPLMLLVDADIALAPGTVTALRLKMQADDVQLVSLMAAPSLRGFWERLLLPAYIYFFKLLYPFQLSNLSSHPIAAAAGGCILLETRALDQIGGFAAIRNELIDDCALARRIKQVGYRTWTGLTHSAVMQRQQGLTDIWSMVARTAFTQLHYSILGLGLCTAFLMLLFAVPILGVALAPLPTKLLAIVGYFVMVTTYLPTLHYYKLSYLWALALPVTGILYLAMTWTSAWHYWNGHRSQWKNRTYVRAHEPNTRD